MGREEGTAECKRLPHDVSAFGPPTTRRNALHIFAERLAGLQGLRRTHARVLGAAWRWPPPTQSMTDSLPFLILWAVRLPLAVTPVLIPGEPRAASASAAMPP